MHQYLGISYLLLRYVGQPIALTLLHTKIRAISLGGMPFKL